MSNVKAAIETVADGKLKKITLKNDFLEVILLDYGARLHQIFAPDRQGKKENVLLSYDEFSDVLNDQSFFGATIGPVAGRIRHAQWKEHTLEKNCGEHHIHGGSKGWAHRYWKVKIIEEADAISALFSLTDDASGYPGPIYAETRFRLIRNQLEMTISAQSSQQTIVNPTNHAYFNLSGDGKRNLYTHELAVDLEGILSLDKELLPTGEILPEKDLPLPFKKNTGFSEIFSAYPHGLDDVFVLAEPKLTHPSLHLQEKESGRQLAVATTNKSMVLFSTTGFEDTFKINGKAMHSNYGLAIEPQEFPDLANFPQWGSSELAPGQVKTCRTIYTFTAS
ncbi:MULTISPECIES: aldose epimerase family protein [unclassified Enterococcus]|jgi:aldose 1-epimerase|uniref:aldose epimerase family protein n=1 Tax=unclassified Enterococcus TaxID=2608891 RepID=UPI003D2E7F18